MSSRKPLVVIASILSTISLSGQSFKTASAMDIGTMLLDARASAGETRNFTCYENDPLYGNGRSKARFYIQMPIQTVAISLLSYELRKHHKKWWVLPIAIDAGSHLVGGIQTIRNCRQVPLLNQGLPSIHTWNVGATFTPGQVSLSPTSGGMDRPYMNISGQSSSPNVGAEAVRASGSGPFDDAYRQNLATYEGGLFAKPGGLLSINPTGSLFGNPTGGGNAPLPGAPTGLLDQALAGMGYSSPPPTQTANASPAMTSVTDPTSNDNWQFWLNQFGNKGSMFDQASTL